MRLPRSVRGVSQKSVSEFSRPSLRGIRTAAVTVMTIAPALSNLRVSIGNSRGFCVLAAVFSLRSLLEALQSIPNCQGYTAIGFKVLFAEERYPATSSSRFSRSVTCLWMPGGRLKGNVEVSKVVALYALSINRAQERSVLLCYCLTTPQKTHSRSQCEEYARTALHKPTSRSAVISRHDSIQRD